MFIQEILNKSLRLLILNGKFNVNMHAVLKWMVMLSAAVPVALLVIHLIKHASQT